MTGEKNLEAQVFLKHKEMFEASIDCLCILKDLRERCLISESLERKIITVVENKRKRNG